MTDIVNVPVEPREAVSSEKDVRNKDQDHSRPRPGPMLWIAMIWIVASLGLAMVDLWHSGAETSAQERFGKLRDAEHKVSLNRVTNGLTEMYQDLRTIARLPGVRRVSRHGENLTEDSSTTIRELYALLHDKLRFSEVYIVPIDFAPDRLDPATGRPEEPIATFDEHIVGRHAEVSVGSQVELEETEEHEYRLMAQQAKYLRETYPTDDKVSRFGYPGVTGPEVVTCDNSRVQASAVRDSDRSGLVFSVPVYAPDGNIHAMVSGVILTAELAALLPGPSTALYSRRWDYTIARGTPAQIAENAAYVRALRPVQSAAFSRVGRLATFDTQGDWHYWTALPMSEFTSSHDYEELQRFTALVVAFIATIALFATTLVAATIKARESLEEENLELEKAVQSRTADLLRARRMEAIGELAAGMAHEINTPSQFVGDNLAYLRRSAAGDLEYWKDLRARATAPGCDPHALVAEFVGPKGDKAVERKEDEVAAVDDCLDGIGRIRDIVRSLREFAHPGLSGRELASINRVVENALTVTRNEWKNVARIDLRLTESLDAARCNPGEIGQVLVNLIVNAAHAIKGSGRPMDQGVIRITTGRADDFLEIRIYDNGSGVSEDLRRRVWDQFFTTKAVGVGTGMGLAIVRNIVDRHQGNVSLDSELGCWTEFVVRLPYVIEADESDEFPEVA